MSLSAFVCNRQSGLSDPDRGEKGVSLSSRRMIVTIVIVSQDNFFICVQLTIQEGRIGPECPHRCGSTLWPVITIGWNVIGFQGISCWFPMTILPFIFLYLVCTVVFIFVLLFGENVIFQGTPVSWLHWLITQGSWEGFE